MGQKQQMLEQMSFLARKARLVLSEWILPDRFYVQEKSFACYYRKEYPDFKEDVRIFNHRPDKIIRDGNRWLIIRMLMDQVAACVSGEYAELGTFQGRTARLIYKNMPKDAKLYCFDTFQGFDRQDVEAETMHSSSSVKVGDYGNTCEADAIRYITDNGETDRLIMRKGFFPETARGLEDVTWRFVHLDCDLAAPTKAGLYFFWRNLIPGGVILIHDFSGGFNEGIQNAFEDFSRDTKCVPVPICDGGGSAVVTKPR